MLNFKQACAALNSQDEDLCAEAREWLLSKGLCADCACEQVEGQLGRFQSGNMYENAGRECLLCGEFTVCGEQPEYEFDNSGHSDADSGL